MHAQMPALWHLGAGSDTMQKVHGAGVKSNINSVVESVRFP